MARLSFNEAFVAAMSASPRNPPRASNVSPSQRPAVLAAAQMTKWVTSAAVGGTLLVLHNSASLLVVTGGLANAAGTKALKGVLNLPRPDSDAARTKTSSGMPSSHASNLAFFAALALEMSGGAPPAYAALGVAMFMASWRVGAGFHTWPQVVAGFLFGGTTALAWARVLSPALEPEVDALIEAYGAWPMTVAVGGIGVASVLGADLLKMRKSKTWLE